MTERRAAHAAAAALARGQGDRRSGCGPHAAVRRARAPSPGPAGTARPTSRCRSPRTSRSRSRCRSWSRARTSRLCSSSRRACGPTPRRTASTRRTCSATSARSPRASSTRPSPARHLGARRLGRGPGRPGEGIRPLPARPARLQAGRCRLDGPRARRLRQATGTPGDTLVTSIDARVQSVVEQQLAQTITTARHTYDPVTHRNYVADSGAVVVLDAKNGRVVAMAGSPTYQPKVWVGGITTKQLKRALLREGALPAAVPRHPGPVRTRLDVEAVHDHRCVHQRRSARLAARLLVGLPGRQPAVQELRVRVLRLHRLRTRRCRSPATRSSTASATRCGSATAPTSRDVNAKDPLVTTAKKFGFGKPTGIDLPGEASGRIADRHWKLAYWKANKGYYCKIGKTARLRLPARVRARVLRRGLPVPRRRRRQLRHRPGRHARDAAAVGTCLRRARQRRHALRAPGGQGDRRARRAGDQAHQARRRSAT